MPQNSHQAVMSQDFDSEFKRSRTPSVSKQLDLTQYFRILRKHKWPITLFTAVVTAMAAYYAFTATPVYRSTSTMVMLQNDRGLVGFEEFGAPDTSSEDYFQTQVEILRGVSLSKRVIDKLGLWNNPELNDNVARTKPVEVESELAEETELPIWRANVVNALRSALGFEDNAVLNRSAQTVDSATESINSTSSGDVNSTPIDRSASAVRAEIRGEGKLSTEDKLIVKRFLSRVSISPIRKTEIIQISFQSTDPELAALVANTIAEEYIVRGVEDKLQNNAYVASQLSDRLGELKTILDFSEERLITFKQANGLVDVDGSVGRLNEQELLIVTAELAQARSEQSAQASIFREVQNLAGRTESLQSIPAIQTDPLVQRTRIDLGQVQRTLDELRNRYGERHPRVIDATSQLETLNTTLEGHVNRVVGSISNNYQQVSQRVASIEAKLQSGKQEIQALGAKRFQLDELEREVQTNRDIYEVYFNQIAQSKSVDGLGTANARISEFAFSPVNSFKPKRQLIIALAALSSLILSMLMAFLYEHMDDTVKSTDDIEEKLGVKMIGIIPMIKSGTLSGDDYPDRPFSPLDIQDKKGRFTEAMNTARTAILIGDGKQGRKIITVTSSVPGEGKSTTAVNLAYSLSQMERVLLIDCDIRRPTVAKIAGLDDSASGLSSLIAGTAEARHCITMGAFKGAFDVLPAGPISDQPLELLASRRFERILEDLSRYYDRIVIDSAPTQAVSDALVLGRLSDAVLYCVESGETSIALVKRGLSRLKEVDATIAGVVITQVDIDKLVSYGGDYYYGGYYGYDSDAEDSVKPDDTGKSKITLTKQELILIRSDDSAVDLGLGAIRNNTQGKVADVQLNSLPRIAKHLNSSRAIGNGGKLNNGGKFDNGGKFNIV